MNIFLIFSYKKNEKLNQWDVLSQGAIFQGFRKHNEQSFLMAYENIILGKWYYSTLILVYGRLYYPNNFWVPSLKKIVQNLGFHHQFWVPRESRNPVISHPVSTQWYWYLFMISPISRSLLFGRESVQRQKKHVHHVMSWWTDSYLNSNELNPD